MSYVASYYCVAVAFMDKKLALANPCSAAFFFRENHLDYAGRC